MKSHRIHLLTSLLLVIMSTSCSVQSVLPGTWKVDFEKMEAYDFCPPERRDREISQMQERYPRVSILFARNNDFEMILHKTDGEREYERGQWRIEKKKLEDRDKRDAPDHRTVAKIVKKGEAQILHLEGEKDSEELIILEYDKTTLVFLADDCPIIFSKK